MMKFGRLQFAGEPGSGREKAAQVDRQRDSLSSRSRSMNRNLRNYSAIRLSSYNLQQIL